MGSLFRSEEMCLAQLYLQTEAAYACVSELGELGLVQFRDLNPDVNAFQRKFVNEVRRCDEMERKLRFLDRELNKDNIIIEDTGENPDAPLPREMIDLESTFEKLENDMKEVNTNQEALKRNFLELTELKHILRKTQNFFEEMDSSYEEEILNDIERQQRLALKLGFVAGVIAREKVPAFERILWRACRGNVFLRYAEIETPLEDPHTGEKVYKCVFIIFFQGDQLKTRVKKICEGFRATLYPCPETPQERREIAIGVMTRIEDLQTVLDQTDQHRKRVLTQVATSIRVWFIKVRKIKAIYHTLNLFNVNIAQKCLIAECWCPVADLDKIHLALRRGTESSGSSVPSILHQMKTKHEPPTYNRNTPLTSAFQGMVDAYGVANYREVNPAPFTVITFPFLFAVMFGDLGHGLILFLFGLWLVMFEKRLEKFNDSEFWEMIYGGRYIIFLMGAFSIYTGFLYNECFSRSLNIFGSAWNASAMEYTNKTLDDTTLKFLTLDPARPGVMKGSGGPYPNVTSDPYPYGMDPIWQLAENKITFLNSYKMKGSVIIGITHMIFGLVLSLLNYIYFNKRLNIWTVFVPQLLFINAIFGYLVIIIIYKWAAWGAELSKDAPSLLIGLINMFMFKAPTNGVWLYNGQNGVQIFLVLVAGLCVPWLLFVKPYILYKRNQQKVNRHVLHVDPVINPSGSSSNRGRGTRTYGDVRVAVDMDSDDAPIIHHDQLDEGSGSSEVAEHEEEEEFDMTEIMIHQMIETIEYCLSCISHTASYLRLWALSLAHAELSEVLWTMVMHIGLSIPGPLGVVLNFFIFWAFSCLTVGILLGMEGLSAFLHALRLHWVEFQDKFYGGEGHPFTPFSFEAIVEGKSEEGK
ncbi:V-type proton ATPase 116 kDa subunit a 1-like isoform X2 [Styela clava]